MQREHDKLSTAGQGRGSSIEAIDSLESTGSICEDEQRPARRSACRASNVAEGSVRGMQIRSNIEADDVPQKTPNERLSRLRARAGSR